MMHGSENVKLNGYVSFELFAIVYFKIQIFWHVTLSLGKRLPTFQKEPLTQQCIGHIPEDQIS